ncbi:HNH endonuclease [Enterobacter kobei]|uniref:HNH endonuclease n=1 Tax=Enterobacter kobei TaxID=208224 RepID=UPI002FF8CC5B
MSNKYEDLIKNARMNADCGEHMSPAEVTTLLNVVETTFAALAAENAWLKEACGGDGSYRDCPACAHSEYIEAPDTPATDASLAEVKREATEPLEKEIEGFKKQLLMSVGDIRDLIDYNPETGVLKAKVNFSGRQAGSVIGSQTRQGYYAFSLFGKKCFAHRLAWLLHYGEWPSQPIDHINGIKTDNSIRNLRLCSLSQNQFNKPTQKNNTTGVKGVYWNKRDKRYVASVQFNGKKYSAGHHKDIESAKEAVMKLREKLAGEFTNHGEFELAAQLRQGDDQ